ncbi:unnamed protein product [Phytomonas sp. EM1]|nr:unnamed protein product [Phytomonas sp. EM1]|eukprot:CCW65308.1 unnamed protein product [Phytomonas sp. isolate EM1]
MLTRIAGIMINRHARLPVQLLLDIDGTLLIAPYQKKLQELKSMNLICTSDSIITPEHIVQPFPLYGRHIQYVQNGMARERFVVLRPFVLECLSQLLVHRQLDTPRVHVLVSLYTKQCAGYASAVCQQLLDPFLRKISSLIRSRCNTECFVDPGPIKVPSFFNHTFGGEHCLVHEDSHREAGGWPNPSEGQSTVSLMDTVWISGGQGWKKSVRVVDHPFSALLVDDTVDNFNPFELQSGRCVLVPTFSAKPEEVDEVFACNDGTHESLYKEMKSQQIEGIENTLGTNQLSRETIVPTCLREGGERRSISLFHLLSEFVHTCDACAEELRACGGRNLKFDAKSAFHGGELLQFNFLTRQEAQGYYSAWNKFHAEHEEELSRIFSFHINST